MGAQITVKRMRVLAREVVKCSYCAVVVKHSGLLVRQLDDDGKLTELLFFCSTGCGMAHASDLEPDSDADEVVIGQ